MESPATQLPDALTEVPLIAEEASAGAGGTATALTAMLVLGTLENVETGSYCTAERVWLPGDSVSVTDQAPCEQAVDASCVPPSNRRTLSPFVQLPLYVACCGVTLGPVSVGADGGAYTFTTADRVALVSPSTGSCWLTVSVCAPSESVPDHVHVPVVQRIVASDEPLLESRIESPTTQLPEAVTETPLIAGTDSVGTGGTAIAFTATLELTAPVSVETGSYWTTDRLCAPAESVIVSDQVLLCEQTVDAIGLPLSSKVTVSPLTQLPL